MTGWGQTGPLASSAGHDIGYIALTGALGATGRPDERPGAAAEPAGRLRRRGSVPRPRARWPRWCTPGRPGEGQVVDAAIVDGTAVLTTMIHGMLAGGSWIDRRGAEPARHRGAVLRRLPLRRRAVPGRRGAGGAVLRGAAATAWAWPATSRCPTATDPRQWPALRERFTEVFASPHPGGVVGGVRGHRRLRRAGAGRCSRRPPTRTTSSAGCSSRSTARCSPPSPRGSRSRPARSARCRRWGSTARRSAPSSASDRSWHWGPTSRPGPERQVT